MKKIFTHIGEKNKPKMVDVTNKKVTKRKATAKATMFLGSTIISQFNNDELITKKGPVFQTAIVAGYSGSKKNSGFNPNVSPLNDRSS